MIAKLEVLVKTWEKERDFLCGPDDLPGDRAIGKIYGECAKQLKEAIASQPAAEGDYCAKCGRLIEGDSWHQVCEYCVDPPKNSAPLN